MSAEFEIRVEGMREVEAQMAVLFARTGDLLPLMEGIGEALTASTRRRFEAGAGPDGKPWKPSLRAQLEGGQTLLESGRLRDSVHAEIEPDRVMVGSDLIYAAVHQLGATIRPVQASALRFELPGGLGFRSAREVTIPARPYLGISEEDEAEITHQVMIYTEATL